MFANRSVLCILGDKSPKKAQHPEHGLRIHARERFGDHEAPHHSQGQTMRIHRLFSTQRLMLLGGLAVAIANNGVLAAAQPITSSKIVSQIDRYSELTAGPTLERRDLLAVTVAVSIPNNIASLGGALRWILRDSGYRLAADSVIPPEVHSMLKLPLPAAHRRLGPMPLKEVLALMVGPEFHIVQDPVHRLLSFERCDTVQNSSQAQGEL